MKRVRARFFPDLTAEAWESKRKTIYKWKKKKEKILEYKGKILEQQKIRMRGSATTLPKDAENELVGWIDELRSEGAPVPGRLFGYVVQVQKKRE